MREKEFLRRNIPNYEELSEEEIKRLYHHMLKDHAEEVARYVQIIQFMNPGTENARIYSRAEISDLQ